MSVPFRVDDGDYTVAKEISRDMAFPFSERGDGNTFEVTIRFEQDKLSFKKLPIGSAMQFPLGAAYFVNQGNPTDVGSGLWQFDRTWSMVPSARTEGETVTFTFNLITITGGALNLETSFPATTTADVVYEYFNNTKPQALIAPRYYFSGFIPDRIVVQDSEVGIYKGNIYYRKTYYANVKNIVFFNPS